MAAPSWQPPAAENPVAPTSWDPPAPPPPASWEPPPPVDATPQAFPSGPATAWTPPPAAEWQPAAPGETGVVDAEIVEPAAEPESGSTLEFDPSVDAVWSLAADQGGAEAPAEHFPVDQGGAEAPARPGPDTDAIAHLFGGFDDAAPSGDGPPAGDAFGSAPSTPPPGAPDPSAHGPFGSEPVAPGPFAFEPSAEPPRLVEPESPAPELPRGAAAGGPPPADPPVVVATPVEPDPGAIATREPAPEVFSGARAGDPDPGTRGDLTGLDGSAAEHYARLDRATVPEWIAFAAAFVLPPLGLIAGIAAAVVSSVRRGWVIRLDRATIVVAVVMSLVFGVAGWFGKQYLDEQAAFDETVAASAQWCQAMADNPDLADSPTFGWPAPGPTIAESITEVQTYIDSWTAIAEVAPSGVRPEVDKITAAAQDILNNIQTARLVDDASNIAVMESVRKNSGIPAYRETYCGVN
ncbi:MAG: hypothetical protein J0G30_10105 [Actinomycetales bacterium]|nr:hypothetical protein [Actinomycetales bacterium]